MEVVSWYVMIGVGQVVTLRFPAEKLREVNLAIEQSAWGAFRTKFYPTTTTVPWPRRSAVNLEGEDGARGVPRGAPSGMPTDGRTSA